jgi:hypothetical protein
MKTIVLTIAVLACAASPTVAQTAACSDGSTSYSEHFQGTCSHHGGVAVWYDEEMEAQANQWCDDNPSLCENSHWAGIEGHDNHRVMSGYEIDLCGLRGFRPGGPCSRH